MTDGEVIGIASNPGGLTLSHSKWTRLHARDYGWRDGRADPRRERDLWKLEQSYVHGLQIGNVEAAIVIALQPLPLVAVYSADFDNVVVLAFPRWIAQDYSLQIGTKLVTVSTFAQHNDPPAATDTWFGGNATRSWGNFQPMIAHFVTDSDVEIAHCMSTCEDYEWQLVWELGLAYHRANPRHIRNGEPMRSIQPSRAPNLRTYPIPARGMCKPVGWGPPLPHAPPAGLPPKARAAEAPQHVQGTLSSTIKRWLRW